MVAELRCFNTSSQSSPDACVCVCVHTPVLADRKYPWHCNFQSNLNWADKCVIGMLPLCCQRYLSVRELICLAHWSSKLKIYSQTLLMFLKLICCVEARFEGLCVCVNVQLSLYLSQYCSVSITDPCCHGKPSDLSLCVAFSCCSGHLKGIQIITQLIWWITSVVCVCLTIWTNKALFDIYSLLFISHLFVLSSLTTHFHLSYV